MLERWEWNGLLPESESTTDIPVERPSRQSNCLLLEMRLSRTGSRLLLQREKAWGTNGAGSQWFRSCSIFCRGLSKCSMENLPRWKVLPPGSQNQCPQHLLLLKENTAPPTTSWNTMSSYCKGQPASLVLWKQLAIGSFTQDIWEKLLSFSNFRYKANTAEHWKPLTEPDGIPPRVAWSLLTSDRQRRLCYRQGSISPKEGLGA